MMLQQLGWRFAPPTCIQAQTIIILLQYVLARLCTEVLTAGGGKFFSTVNAFYLVVFMSVVLVGIAYEMSVW